MPANNFWYDLEMPQHVWHLVVTLGKCTVQQLSVQYLNGVAATSRDKACKWILH